MIKACTVQNTNSVVSINGDKPYQYFISNLYGLIFNTLMKQTDWSWTLLIIVGIIVKYCKHKMLT